MKCVSPHLGRMRRARWLATWRNSKTRPVFYHCISRVVDRRRALGPVEKEKFRALMRIYEKFSGCRVVCYCIMSNHFHILLEVPPMPENGFSDADLLQRLSAIYCEAEVAVIAKDLTDAREIGATTRAAEIHARYTCRMHSLSQFMKWLLQKYTRWHNRQHQRTGTLWEERFKSVIVEDGTAAKTMAAYIDLNPVRAGICADPAAYRWSSYGEACGAGKSNGKTARAGLVRALQAHDGISADADLWPGKTAEAYRKILLAGTLEQQPEDKRKSALPPEIPANSLHFRIRYFTDGAVIGSKSFVNEAFASARERFGLRRKDGARKMRGTAAALAGEIWNLRDLRLRI